MTTRDEAADVLAKAQRDLAAAKVAQSAANKAVREAKARVDSARFSLQRLDSREAQMERWLQEWGHLPIPKWWKHPAWGYRAGVTFVEDDPAFRVTDVREGMIFVRSFGSNVILAYTIRGGTAPGSDRRIVSHETIPRWRAYCDARKAAPVSP